MKTIIILLLVLLPALALAGTPASPLKERLIILADMGNEPDEEQQMVHMLLYANELDIEGLIAVTGKYLKKEPRPEMFFELIGGYEKALPNLRQHADGWPTASELRSVVTAGQPHYGYQSIGEGKSSPGSRALERAILNEDPRPLHIVVNAGSNTLAQAIIDLELSLTKEEFSKGLSKLRVYENGAQDNCGAWIMHRWPEIYWIRSNYQTYAYGGPSWDGAKNNSGNQLNLGPYVWKPYPYTKSGQHQWAVEHIKGDHGPLLKLWPLRQFPSGHLGYLEGGGTIPWLRLVDVGLSDPAHPEWGGWGGRYETVRQDNLWSKHADVRADEASQVPFSMYGEARDTWTDPDSGTEYEKDIFAPVWRWRDAFFRDFAARADWSVNTFEQANHPPIARLAGFPDGEIVTVNAEAGHEFQFDAAPSSDPDGDALDFSWWIYPEAGSSADLSGVSLDSDGPEAILGLPIDTEGDTIHLILEVTDKSQSHAFTRYRRIIIVTN